MMGEPDEHQVAQCQKDVRLRIWDIWVTKKANKRKTEKKQGIREKGGSCEHHPHDQITWINSINGQFTLIATSPFIHYIITNWHKNNNNTDVWNHYFSTDLNQNWPFYIYNAASKKFSVIYIQTRLLCWRYNRADPGFFPLGGQSENIK